MTAIFDEVTLESRVGFEAALREYALPRMTKSDHVDADMWVLRSPMFYRREVSRSDRAVCGLLSGDFLAAAQDMESAGPVGAGLVCLRVSVLARRQQRARTDIGEIPAAVMGAAPHYLEKLAACILVPPSDRFVWVAGIEGAAGLWRSLIQRPPSAETREPLSTIAAAMVGMPLLARRAFAAVFVASFAELLRVAGAADGMSELDCARRHAVLTIAYIQGQWVEWHNGRLYVRSPPSPPNSRDSRG